MTTTLRPLSNQVLIQRIGGEESMTTGGLALPRKSSARAGYARVLACGPRVTGVHVGDVIPFNVRSGDGYQVKLDGIEHFMIREPDIAFVYEDYVE